jgi:hypothetical protein
MNCKYFGDYLIQKGVLTDEHLVDALIEQLGSTPSLCQVVHQQKMLPPHTILEAFRYQQDHQVEFLEACRAIGVWSTELQGTATTVLEAVRKPLGQILVNRGLVDLKKLTYMLDEFLSQIAAATPAPEAVAPPASAVATDATVDTFQPGILMELGESFDDKKKKIARTALVLLKENSGGDMQICRKLLQDVQAIIQSVNRAVAFLAMDKLTELLTTIEARLGQILSGLPARPVEEIVLEAEALIRAIDVAWGLRMSIINTRSESAFFSQDANGEKFASCLAELKDA